MNFVITEQQDYKIDGSFTSDDFVLPLNSQIQSMNSLIKMSKSKKWKEQQKERNKSLACITFTRDRNPSVPCNTLSP